MGEIVTPRDAEQNAANRMQELGFIGAAVTPNGPDGGIDVRSRGAVAQVKNWYKNVGTPELQRLFGARGSDHNLQMLFFARAGYAKGAHAYADKHLIALFTFDHIGEIKAVNDTARSLLTRSRSKYTAKPSGQSKNIAKASDRKVKSSTQRALDIARSTMNKLSFTGCSDWKSTNGIDIELHSKTALAKVRSGVYPFYLDELRKLSSEAQGKQALVFSRKEYTEEIVDHANLRNIALFQFDEHLTRVQAANHTARSLEKPAASSVAKSSKVGRTRSRKTSKHKGRSQSPWLNFDWRQGFRM